MSTISDGFLWAILIEAKTGPVMDISDQLVLSGESLEKYPILKHSSANLEKNMESPKPFFKNKRKW